MRNPEFVALNAGLTALLKRHGIFNLLWELETIMRYESRRIDDKRKTDRRPRGAYSRLILANQIMFTRQFAEFANIK